MILFKKKKDKEGLRATSRSRSVKCRFIGTLIWGLLLLILGLLELAKSLGWINFQFSVWSIILIAGGLTLFASFGWKK
ncbi:MAG TPA: hypothetical protein VJA47_06660 [archaeon]|nr:hypothetical protein [archaeon]